MKLKITLAAVSLIFLVVVYQTYNTFRPVKAVQTPPIVTVIADPTHLVIEPGDNVYDIHFYNLGDRPSAQPYMSVYFKNLSTGDWGRVETWHEEMMAKLRELGGVHTTEDYTKITPLVTEYSVKFITTQANYIAIEFPREKAGILLLNKKRAGK